MSHREVAAFAARMKKMSLTVGHADLIDAVNGHEQDVLIGTLPPGAVVHGRAFKLAAYFTGGGATAVTVALGTGAGGVPALIQTATNIFDTTVLNTWQQGTAGTSPVGPIGTALYAQFDCDAGHNLLGLTAGSVTIEIYYSVPDASSVD